MAVLIVRKAERKDRTRVMYILSSMVLMRRRVGFGGEEVLSDDHFE